MFVEFFYFIFFAGLSSLDKTHIEQTAEVLVADAPIIADVAYSAKQLKWAACTWAGDCFNPFHTESTLLPYILEESIFNLLLNGVRL